MRTPNRASVAALSLFSIVVSSGGCADSKPAPTTPTEPSPAPVTLTIFAINGNAAFTSVGETSQLTGKTTFSDGSTKEVTNEVKWVSVNQTIVTISSTGLLVVRNLGATEVYGTYQNRTAYLYVRATPPGTFTVGGRVREPGRGDLYNVSVLETISGGVVRSTSNGQFSMGGLTAAHLRFDLDGYESKGIDPSHDARDGDDVPMQRIVRLTAGETLTPLSLAEHDVSYDVGSGQNCTTCRLIRVDVPSAGTLHLTLSWTNQTLALALWVGGQQFVRKDNLTTVVDVDVPVTAGQVIVYAQRFTSPIQVIPFTLATSLTP